jgi:steroid delta-isomerase-like uncharacterized protein
MQEAGLMRVIGILGFSLLAACSQTQPAPIATPGRVAAPVVATPVLPAKPTPAPASERAVLDAFLNQVNAHDVGEAGALLDEHVHYFDAFSGQVQRDRASATKEIIAMYMNAVPDGHWEIRSEPAASGGAIAYEWTFTGTNLGSWGGIGASHQKINLKGVSFVRIANGKIVYKADYFDTATLSKQLGW